MGAENLNKTNISQEKFDKVWSIIEPIKTGMFHTIEDNVVHSRPMHNIQDQFSGKLWFFTNIQSEKTAEVLLDQSVSVSYSDASKGKFVQLSGTAKVVQDKELIEKFWNDFIEMWFDGKRSESVALFEVDIDFIEYWEGNSTISTLVEIVKSKLTGDRPNLGENKKFTVI